LPQHPTEALVVDEPTSVPERPRWLSILRRVVALVLLPIAVAFAAWPVLLFGGYRAHFVLDDAMAPRFRRGSMAILQYQTHVEPARGKAYGVRVGSAASGQVTRIRRVVALPGDRVRLESGAVVLNGESVTETYIVGEPGPTLPDEEAERAGLWRRVRADGSAIEAPVEDGALVVPETMCLVLPDDRKELLDPSEYLLVPIGNVAAEVMLPTE